MPRFLRLKSQDSAASRPPVGRLIAVALAVFIACMGISVGLFFAARSSEDADASRQFLDGADDLAVKVVTEYSDHARDLRTVALRTSQVIEGRGCMVGRPSFARMTEDLRFNPRRVVNTIGLSINVSDAQRARYEATLTAESGKPKWMYSPNLGPAVPIASAPWYATNLFVSNGSEAFWGFETTLRGWAWSPGFASPLADQAFRQSRGGRVVASPPLVFASPAFSGMFFSL